MMNIVRHVKGRYPIIINNKYAIRNLSLEFQPVVEEGISIFQSFNLSIFIVLLLFFLLSSFSLLFFIII